LDWTNISINIYIFIATFNFETIPRSPSTFTAGEYAGGAVARKSAPERVSQSFLFSPPGTKRTMYLFLLLEALDLN
jgi:hypothetical protein